MTNATIAQAFSEAFETRQRDNGENFACLKDGSPEWMTDAIHAAHGDMLPNDISYGMIRECADAIAEILADDADADFSADYCSEQIDGLIPCYNADRMRWLASHTERVGYCDEVLEDMGGRLDHGDGMMEIIARGMFNEYESIWGSLADAIEAEAELCADEDGEDEEDLTMKRTLRTFRHTFGSASNNLSVEVPAGSPCDFHRENDCWYVRPSAVPPFYQHDAEHSGIPVPLDNLEA